MHGWELELRKIKRAKRGKGRKYFFAFSVLLFTIFLAGLAVAACVDSDKGSSAYWAFGKVTYAGKTYNDFCKDAKNLTEYYCSAGKVSALFFSCPNGCISGKCKPKCSANSATVCFGGDVYWYDSCGGREAKKDECGSNECAQGACQGVPACTPKSSLTCYLGASWWVDSCGNLGQMVKNCSGNCENGECKAQPDNTLNIGWKCKDSSKMAYYVNGTWISELPCVLGCSNNSCNYPFRWDQPETKKKFIYPVLVQLAEIIFGAVATYGRALILMVGSTILIGESGIFHTYEWPEYGYDWATDFQEHYDKHVLKRNEFNRFLTSGEYKDICKDQINSKSFTTNRYRQTDGRFVSLDVTSNLVVIGTPDGKLVTCFIPQTGDELRDMYDKIKRGTWKPIPVFRIMVI